MACLMYVDTVALLLWCARRGGGLTLLVRRRKPFFYFMPGYQGASRAFAIRKLLIAAACDTGIPVSQAVQYTHIEALDALYDGRDSGAQPQQR